mmetsp:Transcript_95916/g.311003  ORF Transcript_95916/g.311003 Transcript_95916/m.311003 type:complete len:566 (-) Transcript_95916:130-1827(-)
MNCRGLPPSGPRAIKWASHRRRWEFPGEDERWGDEASEVSTNVGSLPCSSPQLPASWIGYAPVARVGRRLFSPTAGEVTLGVPCQAEGGGGLVFCMCPCKASRLRFPGLHGGPGLSESDTTLVAFKCEGPFMECSQGALACWRFTPFEEVIMDATLSPYSKLSTRHREHTTSSHVKFFGEVPRIPSGLPGLVGAGWNGIGYKLVAKVEGRYFSIFAGFDVEYVLGVTCVDEILAQGTSGLFICIWPCTAARQYIPPSVGGLWSAPRALLRCKCEGPIKQYTQGRFSCARLTALQEVSLPECCDDMPGGHRRKMSRSHPQPHPQPQPRANLRRPVSAGPGAGRGMTTQAAYWEAYERAFLDLCPGPEPMLAGYGSPSKGPRESWTPSTAAPGLDSSLALSFPAAESPYNHGSLGTLWRFGSPKAPEDDGLESSPVSAVHRSIPEMPVGEPDHDRRHPDTPDATPSRAGAAGAAAAPRESTRRPTPPHVRVVPRRQSSAPSLVSPQLRPGAAVAVRAWQSPPQSSTNGGRIAVPGMRRSASSSGRLREDVYVARDLHPPWGDWPTEF